MTADEEAIQAHALTVFLPPHTHTQTPSQPPGKLGIPSVVSKMLASGLVSPGGHQSLVLCQSVLRNGTPIIKLSRWSCQTVGEVRVQPT